MPIYPSKESVIKLTSVAVSGTGAVVAALAKDHTLANVGAVASLVGSLLDDVPDQWIKERAQRKYSQLIGQADANLRLANRPNADAASLGNEYNLSVLCFYQHSHAFEVARVEHLTSILKVVSSGVAFGFSVHNASVGALGGAGALLGAAVAVGLNSHMVSSVPDVPQSGPIPTAPSHVGVGDYKGLMAVAKFYGGLIAAIGCAVGLGIAKAYVDESKFSDYAQTSFLAAVTGAVATGAAFGSMFATQHTRVANRINQQRKILAKSHAQLRRDDDHNPHATVPLLTSARRGMEMVFMGFRS